MTDADRFEAFVRKYQDMVFGTAVRLLGDPTEAEDVSQTVFLKAFERFQALDAQPAAAGWLKTVTTNACLNHLSRVRSRWRFFSELGRTDLGGESAAYEDGLVSQESPAFDLERADGQAHLEQAIRDLPSHQRVPLALFCQWQPKTAHSWGGRLGRSGHSPGDAREAAEPAVTLRLPHAVRPTLSSASADAPASGSCCPGC